MKINRHCGTDVYLDRFSSTQDPSVLKPTETHFKSGTFVARLSPDRPFFVSLETGGSIYLYLEDIKYLKEKIVFLGKIRSSCPELLQNGPKRNRTGFTYAKVLRSYTFFEKTWSERYKIFGVSKPPLRLGKKLCLTNQN